MTDLKSIEHRVVLISDLPEWAKESSTLLEKAIRASLEYYRTVFGIPKRVWINPKDAVEDVQEVDGFKVERRGGCARGKVMIL